MVCPVRVMSFNVRGASHRSDGANLWEKRAAMNIETIRRYGPDVIGFQECHNENPAFQIEPLTVRRSLRSLFFRLWDEN